MLRRCLALGNIVIHHAPPGRALICVPLVVATLWSTSASAAAAGVTERVSVSSGGVQSNCDSAVGNSRNTAQSVSADGRYVVFFSCASNLVPNDANRDLADVFVRDRSTGTTEIVSVSSDGAAGDQLSEGGALSSDGRFVTFWSTATNLVPGDTNGTGDIFVRDRALGTTERVSVSSGGVEGNGGSGAPTISGDGRYVAFDSTASNLVSGDSNGVADVFVHDRVTGATRRVSVSSSGAQANGASSAAQISEDGRYVVFTSDASNLVAGDTNGRTDVFVRDLEQGATERINVSTAGSQSAGAITGASISGDGRYVAFSSTASNLVAGDTNGAYDVFVHDRTSGATQRVSVSDAGVQADGASYTPAISGDGGSVAFPSGATNLVPGDTNGKLDIFVRNLTTGSMQRVSVSNAGIQGNDASQGVGIDADGTIIGFDSFASNLVPDDTNAVPDIFVRDLAATPPVPLCSGRSATIVGTAGDDTLTGTPGNDVIVALGGNDTINAGGGDDVICAGGGNDVVDAGAGNDVVQAGRGRDHVLGGDGNDQIYGRWGSDVLSGGEGDDVLYGRKGADTLNGDVGNDTCYGGSGVDTQTGCETLRGIP